MDDENSNSTNVIVNIGLFVALVIMIIAAAIAALDPQAAQAFISL